MTTIKEMVDRLGCVKAALAQLETEEKEIVDSLKKKGAGVRSGTLFDANIFEQTRSRTDWGAVCRAARVPARIVSKYTESKDILVCTVTARKVRKARRAPVEHRVS